MYLGNFNPVTATPFFKKNGTMRMSLRIISIGSFLVIKIIVLVFIVIFRKKNPNPFFLLELEMQYVTERDTLIL